MKDKILTLRIDFIVNYRDANDIADFITSKGYKVQVRNSPETKRSNLRREAILNLIESGKLYTIGNLHRKYRGGSYKTMYRDIFALILEGKLESEKVTGFGGNRTFVWRTGTWRK